MILLLGIMSFAGVLALSVGISGLDILGMSEEDEGIDQAMPPSDKDIEADPTIVQQISGGEFVDYLSGSADNDLVHLGAGDDFYDGKQSDADAGDDTIYGEEGNDTIRDSRGSDILYGEKGRDVLNAVDHTDHMGSDTLIGGTGKDLLQGDAGDVMMGGGDVDQFEVFIRNEQAPTDQCVHILDFDPEVDKLVIRIDEPIEQAANSDRVIMTYDSQSDATHVFADGKKVAEIFGAYPSDLQDFRIGNFAQIA